MAIGSPLIVSIVGLQHIIFVWTAAVHPAGGFVLQRATDRKLIDRNQTSAATFSLELSRSVASLVRSSEESRPNEGAAEEAGSDRGLYNAGLFEGDIQLQPTQLKNAIRDDLLLWPLAAVPYTVDDSVGCPYSWRCTLLMEAMDHIHETTCVRFKQWTGDPYKIHIFLNDERGACWSPVGRTGYASQDVSLGADCWYKGIVLHELLHAVGFWHEMNRPDRDSWVRVHWANIMQGYLSAFHKQDEHQVDTLGETFDYRSVMMYDEYAFSKDGVSVTLEARHPNVVIGPIWRKTQLSQSDTRRIHSLYSCLGNQDSPGFPTDEICSFEDDTCGFLNAAASTWRWQKVNSGGFLYVDMESWARTPALLHSVNFHARNTGWEQLGCLKFAHYAEYSSSYFKVKIVYLRKVTEQRYEDLPGQDLWSRNPNSAGWTYTQVSLYVHRPFKLIFEANFDENAIQGAVALDDIELLYHPCNSN